MKKFLFLPFLLIFSVIITFFSCSKDDAGGGGNNNTVNCDTVNIVVTATPTDAVPCPIPATNGTITANASGSTGFTFSLDGGGFTANNVFTPVSEGNHTITAKDANGCTKSTSVTVGRASSGPQFASMRNLVTTRCSGTGCHMNGQAGGMYNFDNDCSIVSAWSFIQRECINFNSMPKVPQAPLTTAEKAVITTWISGGHLYSN